MELADSTVIKLEQGFFLNGLVKVIVTEFNAQRIPIKVALPKAEDVYGIVMNEAVMLDGRIIRVGSEIKRELEKQGLPQGKFYAELRTTPDTHREMSFFEPYSTFLVYQP